jgi:hypothetical protein
VLLGSLIPQPVTIVHSDALGGPPTASSSNPSQSGRFAQDDEAGPSGPESAAPELPLLDPLLLEAPLEDELAPPLELALEDELCEPELLELDEEASGGPELASKPPSVVTLEPAEAHAARTAATSGGTIRMRCIGPGFPGFEERPPCPIAFAPITARSGRERHSSSLLVDTSPV